ncbi:hypothetical protein CR513_00541, partial [Mucuna pruriens]
MELEDNVVQFNIFEAIKHPTEDHSIFSIDIIDELVEEHMQIGTAMPTSMILLKYQIRCDGVSKCPKCAKFPIVVTSKPRPTLST